MRSNNSLLVVGNTKLQPSSINMVSQPSASRQELLIELVRDRPFLYNKSRRDYFDLAVDDKVLTSIDIKIKWLQALVLQCNILIIFICSNVWQRGFD